MKIDEAIEIKEQYHEKYRVHMLSDERDADRLSIEALKGVGRSRLLWGNRGVPLLPGETKD